MKISWTNFTVRFKAFWFRIMKAAKALIQWIWMLRMCHLCFPSPAKYFGFTFNIPTMSEITWWRINFYVDMVKNFLVYIMPWHEWCRKRLNGFRNDWKHHALPQVSSVSYQHEADKDWMQKELEKFKRSFHKLCRFSFLPSVSSNEWQIHIQSQMSIQSSPLAFPHSAGMKDKPAKNNLKRNFFGKRHLEEN